MTIISDMEKEALAFMELRKVIEQKRKDEMLKNNDKMFKELISILLLAGSISISFLPTYIQNELKPIIDKYKAQQHSYVDNFIKDDFGVGIEKAQEILDMAKMDIDKYNASTRDNQYDTVLSALLLYGERVIDNIHDDLTNRLGKDMTNIYISGKSSSNTDVESDTMKDKNSTLNTILTGALISKYINPTFKNINNRTNMTAQNESNRSLNHGVLMRYLIAKRDNIPDLQVKWVEVNDERTCQYCRDAANGGDNGDGVYNIGDITPPPLHSRCRCILIPYQQKWGDN